MKKYNKQVVRTREWTFQALLLLLEKQPYEEITISQIAQKAGITRQTFYRHYRTKDDVISFYLDNMILALQDKFANLKKDDSQTVYQLIFSSFFLVF